MDLDHYLRDQVYPNLTWQTVYTSPAHRFQEAHDKLRGACPWHESKTGTSFVVTPSSLLWYCAGCNDGGGPVKYLHRLRGGTGSPKGEDFLEIVRQLCGLAGVPFLERELTAEQQELAQKREARRDVVLTVAAYCRKALWSDAGAQARRYLQSRGLSEDDCRELGFGLYDSADGVKRAVAAAGHDMAVAEEAGVFRKDLAGYITMPWADERGRPLTIGATWNGRTPPDGLPKKNALRNPKPRDGQPWEFTKRSPLYFDRARKAGHDSLVLVEGLTDAAVAQARGDARVVACVAASFSREQVETLARNKVRLVVISLDPDSAGDNGILSCIRSLEAAGITAYVAPQLPDGLDPDDFIVRRGIDAWREHTDKAVHAFRYQAGLLVKKHRPAGGWTDPSQDALVAAAVAFAAARPADKEDELDRHFWPEIGREVGIRLESLRARVQHARAGGGNGAGSYRQQQPPRPREKYDEKGYAAREDDDGGDGDGRPDAWEPEVDRAPPRKEQPRQQQPEGAHLCFERLTGRQFWDAVYTQEYLIEDVMAAGQPSIIGALKKSLKTTLAIDEAVSLATALPFLGKFRVPRPVRVGIMSGESGAYTIQETYKRICRAKGWEPDAAGDNLRFSFQVPRFGDPVHLDALRRFIEEDGLKVLTIDPTYLALPVGESAGNMFAVGALLMGLTELGQKAGCTIQLVHHLRKNVNRPYDPPELEDLAWSGFAEWARQWLLIGRRAKYDPEAAGDHKLWLNVGGSAGHSSLWGLDVQEGRRNDPGGRHWSLFLTPGTTARQQDGEAEGQEKVERKEQQKARTLNYNREKVMRAFRRYPDGGTKTELREAAGLSGTVFGSALTAMLEDGAAVACKLTKGNREYDGFRLRPDDLFPGGEPDNRTTGQNDPD